MGQKYSSLSTSGYASSPPSDDGATTEANKVKFSTIRQKLTDVLKTFGEAINSALVTTLNTSARAVSANDAAAATDHWRTIQVNTPSVTITLADAATMAAGYIVDVANQSTGNITVALASSTDTIDTVTNTTHTISTKETRRYIVNAAATGYISSGAGTEGTWTPAPSFAGTRTGITGTGQGRYTKIGRMVFCDFTYTFTSKGAASGALLIEDLPFVSANNGAMSPRSSGINWSSFTTSYLSLQVIPASVQSYVMVYGIEAAGTGGYSAVDNNDVSNTSVIQGSFVYIV